MGKSRLGKVIAKAYFSNTRDQFVALKFRMTDVLGLDQADLLHKHRVVIDRDPTLSRIRSNPEH